MLQSMTGYGKAQGTFNNKKILVELKSLNSKQSDIYARIPGFYKSFELDFRNAISKKLHRGKMELSISVEQQGGELASKINTAVVSHYIEQLKKLEASEDYLAIAMRLPEALVQSKEEIPEEEVKLVQNLIQEAASELNQYRTQEGEKTQKELVGYIENIQNLLQEVAPFEEERIQTIRERILSNLDKHIDSVKVDKDRFEQELIFYIEKFDISEEKVRLKANCELFLQVADTDNPLKGKKLAFVCQEIGREINTLGSKANHAELQKIVIQMKDELEKIKEQTFNIL